jgi:ABC-type phosphate transport system substrate-binding protein
MNWLRGTKGPLLLAALAMSGTTCTLLLDHNAVQCKTDDDCKGLGTYPHCEGGLCKPSGLMPNGCFLIKAPMVPQVQKDFLNSCSANAMVLIPSDEKDSICLSPTIKPEDGATLKMPPAPTTKAPTLPPLPSMTCKDVAAGKPILYISGSSNFAPLLQELSEIIVSETGIMPVFRITTSCTGVKSMNPTSPTYSADHYIKDPTNAANEPYPTYAQAYPGDGSSSSVPCLLGSPTPVDIGESEIAQDTCGTPNPSDQVGESLGPILPIIFVVPRSSMQKAISSEAAKQVFGGGGSLMNGGGGTVAPWDDPKFLFIRGQGTATLRLVAKQIGLQPNQVWGIDQGSASQMANSLGGITNYDEANKAIGIIGSDYYDQMQNRNQLRALGFQAAGQSCAYLPDSSLTSLDKINVRDGHYPLWGRIHFFAARNNGTFVSPTADAFLRLFAQPVLPADIFKALIKAGFVPPCAMRVTRTTELGDFTYSVPPTTACGCAFDAQVGVTPLDPACATCTTDTDCVGTGRPSCRYGYCELESP